MSATDWRKAAVVVAKMSKDATMMSFLSGAGASLSKEEQDVKAYLAKFDAKTLDAAAAAVLAMAKQQSAPTLDEIAAGAAPAPPPPAAAATSEEAAKRAWLAKLDATTFGRAASTVAEMATQAADMAALSDACDDGEEAACETLGEDEAKAAWLSKLDAPSWGAAAAAVSAVASEVAHQPGAMSANEISKHEWYSKWGQRQGEDVAATAASAALSTAPSTAASSDGYVGAPSVEEAKAAWLAKLDAPSWGKAASAMAGIAKEASELFQLSEDCESGRQQQCASPAAFAITRCQR